MKMNINDVIIQPVITEKTSNLLSSNVYTLMVDSRATKIDVKIAVEYIFSKSNAKVSKVNMIKVKRKTKSLGKYHGFKKGYKKAMVFLKEGSIPVYGAKGIEKEKNKKTLKIIDTEKLMEQAEKKTKKQ
ncbi:MAG: hypothetical protein HPAVJP_5250 [Candidatus Hepatoplasma vulgare]|nr:MAG: hypothetical protein HPAVJP_5250 [Candidatus Hepatoplasma sp.]